MAAAEKFCNGLIEKFLKEPIPDNAAIRDMLPSFRQQYDLFFETANWLFPELLYRKDHVCFAGFMLLYRNQNPEGKVLAEKAVVRWLPAAEHCPDFLLMEVIQRWGNFTDTEWNSITTKSIVVRPVSTVGLVLHSTLLVISRKGKWYQVFDPNGTTATWYEELLKGIQEVVANHPRLQELAKGFTLRRNEDSPLCPKIGAQSVTKDAVCMLWTYLYAYALIHCPEEVFSPTQNLTQILLAQPAAKLTEIIDGFHRYILNRYGAALLEVRKYTREYDLWVRFLTQPLITNRAFSVFLEKQEYLAAQDQVAKSLPRFAKYSLDMEQEELMKLIDEYQNRTAREPISEYADPLTYRLNRAALDAFRTEVAGRKFVLKEREETRVIISGKKHPRGRRRDYKTYVLRVLRTHFVGFQLSNSALSTVNAFVEDMLVRISVTATEILAFQRTGRRRQQQRSKLLKYRDIEAAIKLLWQKEI